MDLSAAWRGRFECRYPWPAWQSGSPCAYFGQPRSEQDACPRATRHIRYILLYRWVCCVEGCTEFADEAHKILIMGDTNHLTPSGAPVVAQQLVERGVLD